MLNSSLIKNLSFFWCLHFARNTYSHLAEHQRSAERSLGNAALINNGNFTGDTTIIQLTTFLYQECHKEILLA